MHQQNKLLRKGLALSAVTALSVLTGCGSGGGGNSDGTAEGGTIALVTNNQIDPFYTAMGEGAEAAGEERGWNITWQAPAEQSAANQTATLQQVAATDPDGIVFSAADADALALPLRQIYEGGTPVISVDSDVNDPEARMALVESNNEQTGREAAEMANELLEGEGKVGHIGYTPGVASLDPRREAWHEQLEEYPEIEDVGNEFADLDVSEYQQDASALLSREPDIDAIFTDWTGACMGTAQAIRQAGLTDEVYLFCADSSPDQQDLLQQGDITALFVQQPYELGRVATLQLIDYIENGEEPEDMELDIVVIDQEAADDPEYQQYFYGNEG